MKNKALILALLVVFASVVFTSCGGDNPKIVKEIKVDKTTDGLYYILSWDAIGKNVEGYRVYASMEDKASIFQLSSNVTNRTKYNLDSTSTDNGDADKWNARVLVSSYSDYRLSGSNEYFFGVRTYSMASDEYSNIKWTKGKYALIGTTY
jgi:hypothetical protein